MKFYKTREADLSEMNFEIGGLRQRVSPTEKRGRVIPRQ